MSASSVQKFTDCAASWITNYDEDRKVSNSSSASDIGNVVHMALEQWRSIGDDQSFGTLEACFIGAAEQLPIVLTPEDYKTGKALLKNAFKLATDHPVIPMHLSETISVEQPLVNSDSSLFSHPRWALPVKGSIDRLFLVPVSNAPPNEIMLGVEDYKTGQPKTHDYHVTENVQFPLYVLWAHLVGVPFIESQVCEDNGEQYKVKGIYGTATYIRDALAVFMPESDFDYEATVEYLAVISKQMVDLQGLWNTFMVEVISKDEKDREEFINAWLAKYEKPNTLCSYCPRKGSCQSFGRLLKYETTIDITNPNNSWDEIWMEYEMLQAVEKAAKNKLDEIKKLVPAYLDFEKISSIKLANGREITANAQNRKFYAPDRVAEVLGVEFILANAAITQKSLDEHIAKVAATDPEKARQLSQAVSSTYTERPGPRPVSSRIIK